jgi:hypothetical protein
MPEATFDLLLQVMGALRAAELPVTLFGGWAEELRGLCAPRPHRDIDLLYRAASFEALEAFFHARPAFVEIAAKRFSHKRAALLEGVMIEFILVQDEPGGPCTHFFEDRLRLNWPPDTFDQSVLAADDHWPVASPAALRFYRAQHGQVELAYQQARAGQSP